MDAANFFIAHTSVDDDGVGAEIHDALEGRRTGPYFGRVDDILQLRERLNIRDCEGECGLAPGWLRGLTRCMGARSP